MNKLTKKDVLWLDEHCEILRKQQSTIDDLREKAQAEIESARAALEALNAAVDLYNEQVSAANDTIEQIAGGLEDVLNDRSDKWCESDRGIAYEEWVEQWTSFTLDELDQFEFVEELEEPEYSALEQLEENRPPTEFEF